MMFLQDFSNFSHVMLCHIPHLASVVVFLLFFQDLDDNYSACGVIVTVPS